MTDVALALGRFWSQFGVDAYQIDRVPDGAELPYITYDVTIGGLYGNAVLTAYNWHKDSLGAHEERTELLDRIAEAIPVGGILMPLENGYLDIRRNSANFQTYWRDPNDRQVIGGRTSYEVIFYSTK